MGQFLDELKRRNVVRVGLAYGVVGWLVIQIIDTVAPRLNLPEWVPTFFIILIAVGFLLALFLAWAYELTPEGVKKTKEVDIAASVTAATGRKLDFVIIGALVLVAGYFIWESRFTGAPKEEATTGAQSTEASIAVLPFVNMSSDKEQTYFSDGISEEILNVLAQIPELHVTSRSSAFRFRGDDIHIPTVANQLGVAHILEGSVRKSGVRVRITAQLIDASADKHIWSETYERELTDIFAIQDEISEAIVDALIERLGITVEAAPKVLAAASTEAYEAYLLGTHQMVKRGAGPLAEAAAHFERALELDPDYAPALAHLGMTYVLLPHYNIQDYPVIEMFRRARPLVERALNLAPDLPEAQAAMGFYLFQDNRDYEAEPYLQRAIELNPSYATAQAWLASLYGGLMRFDEELTLNEMAVKSDPLSPLAVNNLIDKYLDRNMLEEAAPLLARLQQINPLFFESLSAALAEREGRFADAALRMLNAFAIDRNFSDAKGRFSGYLSEAFGLYEEEIAFGFFADGGHYALGNTDKLLDLANRVEQIAPDNPGATSFASLIYWVTGDLNKAREYLERALELLPDGPNKSFGLQGVRLSTLVALRHDTGDEAGAMAIEKEMRGYLRKFEEAGIASPEQDWRKGLLALNDGEDEEGIRLLQKAIDGNFLPSYLDLHHLTRYPHLDFSAMLTGLKAKNAIERPKFLKIVCNGGNPAPEAWTPMPETCEGYVN